MIESHISIEDLVVKEPRFKTAEYKYDELTVNNQIRDAFNRICVDLIKLNIDTSQVMIPFIILDSKVTTKKLIGNWIQTADKNNLRRLVIKVKDRFKTNFKIILEGSNDNGATIDRVVALDVVSNYASSTFLKGYKYYRFKLDSEAKLNENILIYLVETTYDNLIIYKTLETFFTGIFRTPEEFGYHKMLVYRQQFEAELVTINNNQLNNKPRKVIRIGL